MARKLLPGRVSGGRRRDSRAGPRLPGPCRSASLPAVSSWGPSLSWLCVPGLGPALPGRRTHVWPPGGGVPCTDGLLGTGPAACGRRQAPLSGLLPSPQRRGLSDRRAKDTVPALRSQQGCRSLVPGGHRSGAPAPGGGEEATSPCPQRPARGVKGPSGRVGPGQNGPHLRVCGRGVGVGLGARGSQPGRTRVSQPRGPAGPSLSREAVKSGFL